MKNKLSFTTLACPAWDIGTIVGAAVANRYDAIDFRGYLGDVELPDSPAFRGGALRELAARVRDAGLAVSCLGSGAKMTAPDAAARKKELDAMRRYADLCAPFGCRQVRIFGGGADGIADPVANAAETLVAAAAIAKDAGIEFAVETHDSWMDSSKLRAAFDAAGRPDGIALLWDVHHPWATKGEAPETSARNLSPYIRNTHWKDSRPLPDGKRRLCLPGEGDVPLRAVRDALAAVGYDGWFTLEWEKRWHPEIEEPEVAVPAFAAFMRRLAAD
ncbi:MAG: sugar phosphate isomerase/epimerase [Kiritimatiellae bacterium]|nr:sugar phosphate isomerase/epimerase [Kiritimatiellia bacterium]